MMLNFIRPLESQKKHKPSISENQRGPLVCGASGVLSIWCTGHLVYWPFGVLAIWFAGPRLNVSKIQHEFQDTASPLFSPINPSCQIAKRMSSTQLA
jgi:hypothetical protein